MKSPCGEETGIVHCGNYKLNIFHYQMFIFCNKSAVFSLAIAPRGEMHVKIFTEKIELMGSNLVSYGGYMTEFIADLIIHYEIFLHFSHCYPNNTSNNLGEKNFK